MKKTSLILAAAALPLLFLSPWTSSAVAETAARTAPEAVPLPLGKHCVVSLLAIADPKPVVAGKANIVTGFAAPSVAEGTLIRMDQQWIVLHEASADHWIPTVRVLMINVDPTAQ